MTNLVPRRSYQPMSLDDIDLPGTRMPKEVVQALDTVTARGLQCAAQVKVASFVTKVALNELNEVSYYEAQVAKNDPIRAEQAASLVADFVQVARSYVRGMGRP